MASVDRMGGVRHPADVAEEAQWAAALDEATRRARLTLIGNCLTGRRHRP